MDELKEAAWSCQMALISYFLNSIGTSLKFYFFNYIKHFENTGSLVNGCNASFIVMVPNKDDPLKIGDYRPISLIGCTYKVLSKILAPRLSHVIHNLIRQNQTAFISGRQILGGIIVANEIVHYAKKERINVLLLKVDFEKAFDSINWIFLLDVMKQMGFGAKWCLWIYACLSSASVSVLVNGSPTNEFKMECGVRQGDPLSPFLFLIVSEALQVMVIDACNKGIFSGVSLADNGANITLLQCKRHFVFWRMVKI
uniref:Cysteine-rich receptor-like protein kinase n=1 Tax=Tanacetum cinerariifolium TaxID=118510 RepID=A0A699JRB9_TANCI|nr:cysteine-rich receptor-like protein kinase [Tanacetum cinerariifolium]